MRTRVGLRGIGLMLAIMIFASFAVAEGGKIRTYLTFRITTRTQSAIVNAGEDLQIEVGVEGASPTRYQWYFEGMPLEDGDERVYNLVNAQLSDAGIYCMEAYTGDKLAVKVEVNVRVIDTSDLPATGDSSVPVEYAFYGLFAAAAALLVIGCKKRAAVR